MKIIRIVINLGTYCFLIIVTQHLSPRWSCRGEGKTADKLSSPLADDGVSLILSTPDTNRLNVLAVLSTPGSCPLWLWCIVSLANYWQIPSQAEGVLPVPDSCCLWDLLMMLWKLSWFLRSPVWFSASSPLSFTFPLFICVFFPRAFSFLPAGTICWTGPEAYTLSFVLVCVCGFVCAIYEMSSD